MNYEIERKLTIRVNSYAIANPFIQGELNIVAEHSNKILYFPLVSPIPNIFINTTDMKTAPTTLVNIYDVLEEWSRHVPNQLDLLVDIMVKKRNELRINKEFEKADLLRDCLIKAGLKVEDKKAEK